MNCEHTRSHKRSLTVALTLSLALNAGFAVLATTAFAMETGKGVFVEALIHKTAAAPITSIPVIEAALKEIQSRTGNDSPLEIRAQLIQRFSEQPHCGRIVFAIVQPVTQTYWPQMGGQLNICEDGLPPLRICPDRPTVLVPSNSKCGDGALAQDTAEVSKAIQAALASGNITSKRAREQNPVRATP